VRLRRRGCRLRMGEPAATLWPFAIFLGLFAVALVAGWVIYRERGDGQNDNPGRLDNWLTNRQ
jgi:hypothetical protein